MVIEIILKEIGVKGLVGPLTTLFFFFFFALSTSSIEPFCTLQTSWIWPAYISFFPQFLPIPLPLLFLEEIVA